MRVSDKCKFEFLTMLLIEGHISPYKAGISGDDKNCKTIAKG